MLEFHHLLAGISGGIISTVAVHPLDLLKIRYQGDKEFNSLVVDCDSFPCFAVNDGDRSIRPQYNGYLHCARQIVKERGLVGLYQGVTPNLWGAALSWGLYMML